MKKSLLLLSAFLLCLSFSYAQKAGDLDSSFGNNGILSLPSYAGVSALQPDGKFLIGSDNLARYNPDGAADLAFGQNGVVNLNVGFGGISVQNSGKIILVVGNSLIRLNADGSMDDAFNSKVVQVSFIIASVAVQQDDKIVVAGTFQTGEDFDVSDFAVARYDSDGSLDQAFGNDGIQITDFGILFFQGGEYVSDYATSVKMQPDGKIMVAGTTSYRKYGEPISEVAIARYNSNGMLDPSFSDDGRATFGDDYLNTVTDLALLSDGKIVVTGSSFSYYYGAGLYVRIISPAGLFIGGSGFDVPSVPDQNSYRGGYIAVQDDDQIVVSATFESKTMINRYSANGIRDHAFLPNAASPNGVNNIISNIFIFGNKLYATGQVVARYLLTDVNQNTNLKVNITSPNDNQVFLSPANIKVNAEVSLPAAQISKIEFFLGDKLIHTEFKYPYTFTLKDFTQTTILTAKATDIDGLFSISSPINLIVIVPQVTSFIVVNSDSDQDLWFLQEGGVLNLNTFPPHLNLRAFTFPAKVGSVVFMLDGQKIRTENGEPYALGGDSPSGNYHAYNFTPGNHTLTAIPYNKYDGNGTAGIPHTIHFSVVGQSVESFTLINAETNQSIPERLEDGVLNLNSLPLQLNIRANTNPGKVGSVVFFLDGKKVRTENGAPYALGGDNPSGNYHVFNLTLGSHTLTAIPYSNYNGTGTKGLEKTIHFSVVRRNRTSLTTEANPANIPLETVRLGLYPNPVHNLLTISAGGFEIVSGSTISIVNVLGEVIETKQIKNINQVFQLDVSSLSPGNYFLRIVAGEKVLNKRFVKL